jgi:hypothetical protein
MGCVTVSTVYLSGLRDISEETVKTVALPDKLIEPTVETVGWHDLAATTVIVKCFRTLEGQHKGWMFEADVKRRG